MNPKGTPSAEPDFFNVFLAKYEAMEVDYFAGSGAEGRVLYLAPDRRHIVVATRYPLGVSFKYGGKAEYQEAFYVVCGNGSRKLADGTVIEMKPGDLIFVRAGIEIEYVYGVGFVDVAFFWSENSALPSEITKGLEHRGFSR